MTGMDDPTIICCHLMVELSVLAGRKKKSLSNPPWVDKEYITHHRTFLLHVRFNVMTIFYMFKLSLIVHLSLYVNFDESRCNDDPVM